MDYVVLAFWVIQAAVGVALFVAWLRHGRGGSAGMVLTHVALAIVGLALWIAFLATGAVLPAWLAFAALTVGNGVGDTMLVRRYRRTSGSTDTFWKAYGGAIAATFRGALPRRVVFHALFAGVVYFTCLGVCIAASVA